MDPDNDPIIFYEKTFKLRQVKQKGGPARTILKEKLIKIIHLLQDDIQQDHYLNLSSA